MNKYFKRALALLCTLTLVLSLCTVFASAPEAEREEPTRYNTSTDYVAGCYGQIYYDAGGANSLTDFYSNYRLLGITSNAGWNYNSQFTKVTRGSYTGYTQNNRIVPMSNSYKVNSAGHYLTTTAGGSTNAYTYAVPNNSIAYYLRSETGSDGATYYRVRVWIGGNSYIGFLPKSCLTRTYGV